MLRASRKLLRQGGRTAFVTIVVAPGLSPSKHRRVVRAGPRSVASQRSVGELMERAGFEDVEELDVSDRFVATARAWLEEMETHEDEVRRVMGADYDPRMKDRRAMFDAIEEGTLRRLLVGGTAPSK